MELAIASIFGTIVEQNQPPEKYHQIYEDWAYNLMDRISLFDMYHSWWFLALLVLFTVNLTCCTIDRFPKMLKVVRKGARSICTPRPAWPPGSGST
jgi:cytochrome c biogenesis protein